METTTQDSKRKALGRGLEVLLPSARPTPPAPSPTTDEGGSREIPIDLIERNPYQTRRKFSQSAIDELAASITSSGVIQPIVVRPIPAGGYQLISGERRLLASKQAGKTTIPAVIRQVSNQQALEMTIIENLQREDLNAMDQARAYERLAREFNLTQEQMAIKTGKDRASVANFLRLLKLPSEVQAMVESDELSLGHAKALLMLGDEPIILRTATKVVADALSVRKTEALVQSLLYPNSGNEEKANKRSHETADPNVREAQFHLQRALGTKVTIHDKQGKGKIVIEYASLEDFDRVVEALGK